MLTVNVYSPMAGTMAAPDHAVNKGSIASSRLADGGFRHGIDSARMIQLLAMLMLAAAVASPAATQGYGTERRRGSLSASPLPSTGTGTVLDLWPAPPEFHGAHRSGRARAAHGRVACAPRACPPGRVRGRSPRPRARRDRHRPHEPGCGGLRRPRSRCGLWQDHGLREALHLAGAYAFRHGRHPYRIADRVERSDLGEFFTEWGVQLDAGCVGEFCEPATPIAVYLDGEPYEGDPAAIELTDRLVIALVIGAPPPEIPTTYDFSKE